MQEPSSPWSTSCSSNNIGYRLLAKQGWVQGTGLGARRQGRLEPVIVDLKGDVLGLGKAEQFDEYHAASTARPKASMAEILANATDQEREQRQLEHTNKRLIQQEVKANLAVFYCGLCDKQYHKAPEYEAHLSSYDHNHKKRFAEMRRSHPRPANADAQRDRERRREQKELERIQKAALQRTAGSVSVATDSSAASASTSPAVLPGKAPAPVAFGFKKKPSGPRAFNFNLSPKPS
ncbi:hypothetical protein H4R33_000597 [Dimargaris cristalligena]|uniref:G-patch domain-containing protein n=1 Tax=Dimargaris cristalligena TaxID=215637 RepID=A0A4V1J5Q1_9FUNG|nr:hypothetical protein H4R33_000597 [Dimargaris cristalligena]RKP39839.1 hypothetical protein BJ085DRAFT_33392 [Dimargaris cristalligena]|eukprot:RKP39839.1 hypothetical protein BJ085DRAFT_33392 [Dimargaris cristalligena]